jgi:hypothetical protein
VWREFLVFAPITAIGLIIWIAQAMLGAVHAQLRFPSFRSRLLLGFLYFAQPIVRLYGRLSSGMTPWRSRFAGTAFLFPRRKIFRFRNNNLIPEKRGAEVLSKIIQKNRLPAVQGDHPLRWDWQIEGGIFGGARVLVNTNNSEVVLRVWPYMGLMTYLLAGIGLSAGLVALCARAFLPLTLFLAILIILAVRYLLQAGGAMAVLDQLLGGERDWRRSLWERFQPPRHFFVELALPQDAAFIGSQTVALKYQPALEGRDLHQDGGTAAMELISDYAQIPGLAINEQSARPPL